MNVIRKIGIGIYISFMVVTAYYAVKMCFVIMTVAENHGKVKS